jgi:hypothetical protein
LLLITPLDSGTRATHAVATFAGPVTGAVRIECRALAKTFVDDADDVSSDAAGLFLLLCTIALSTGAWLMLSERYRRRVARAAAEPEPTDGEREPADGEPAPIDDRA